MSVPRDPGHYHPSTHAGQMAKRRGIDFRDVAETLANGEVRSTHKPPKRLFVYDCGYEKPVGVVANPECGTVVTIEWRKD